MKHAMLIMLASLLVLAACQTAADQPLNERVPDTPTELLYHDVLGQVTGTTIKVFGIGLGNTEQDIRDLHGEPFKVTPENFNTRLLIEYAFESNGTINVQYKLDRGVVTGILLTRDANHLLHGESVLDHSLEEMYSLLGVPTRIQDLHLERRYLYDEIGYDVYRADSSTHRVYFTRPGRGIPTQGKDTGANELCAQVITPATHSETGECIEFPNACLPEGWEPVESCT